MGLGTLEFVNSYRDVRGKWRHTFRRKGHKRVTIKGRPSSPEFMAIYHALLEKTGGASAEIGASRTKAGTVDAIAVAYYKHDAFTKVLSKATQPAWRNIIDRFREFKTTNGRRYGENHLATIQKKNIMAFLEGRTANAQKNSLKAIRSFIRFAISQGELNVDPTEGVTPLKSGTKSKGHMTWLEPQIEQYRQRHQLGTVARLALELLLNIAARRHDAHLIGSQHVRDGKLSWRPHKTLRSTGKLLTIRIMPSLQTALDAIPKTDRDDGVLTFLVNDYGRPFATAAAFGNKFAHWCRAAGLKPVLCDDGRTRNYRAHGLRKAALRALAHAGATGVELMAVSGHSSLDQVQEYLDDVDQEQMAEAALKKLAMVSQPNQVTTLVRVTVGLLTRPASHPLFKLPDGRFPSAPQRREIDRAVRIAASAFDFQIPESGIQRVTTAGRAVRGRRSLSVRKHHVRCAPHSRRLPEGSAGPLSARARHRRSLNKRKRPPTEAAYYFGCVPVTSGLPALWKRRCTAITDAMCQHQSGIQHHSCKRFFQHSAPRTHARVPRRYVPVFRGKAVRRRSFYGREGNSFRRRGGLRADDGNLEPDRRRCLPRLARSALWLELDRRWMWQRRLHGVDCCALRTS